MTHTPLIHSDHRLPSSPSEVEALSCRREQMMARAMCCLVPEDRVQRVCTAEARQLLANPVKGHVSRPRHVRLHLRLPRQPLVRSVVVVGVRFGRHRDRKPGRMQCYSRMDQAARLVRIEPHTPRVAPKLGE